MSHSPYVAVVREYTATMLMEIGPALDPGWPRGIRGEFPPRNPSQNVSRRCHMGTQRCTLAEIISPFSLPP